MASGGGSSLRRGGSAKITFFVFLDIITAVTGILILVILLFALRAGDGTPSPDDPGGAAAGHGIPPDQTLQATLAERLKQLGAIVVENHRHDLELTAAERAADAETLRAEIAALRTALAHAKISAAQGAAEARALTQAEAARDDAAGLTANRAQIEQAKARLAQLIADNARKREESETLEQQVRASEARLLAARDRGKNRVWLVPELPATSKSPLLVVVSGAGATLERFNRPATRTTLKADDGATAFHKLLASYNRLDDYVVFYVRPSGIHRFEQYRDTAREAGFEVGYDTLAEDRELVFGARPD